MGRGDHVGIPLVHRHVQADQYVKCPLLWHSTPKPCILRESKQGTHGSHSSQALSLSHRDRHCRRSTAPHRVFPQVWQVYDSQGHGEADGAYCE